MDITQGQIWEVITENFLTSGKDRHAAGGRSIKLRLNEKIEIRYPFAWHFRTEDGIYLHADPDMIINNCRLFGVIYPKVKTDNIAKLDEIIKLKLFDRV